jgi:hypothetical protein
MEPLSEHHCRRILEVSDSASMEDITNEYHRLKRIYGEEGGTFDTLSMDEFSPAIRRRILEEIEAAYKELCQLHVEVPPHLPVRPALVLDASLPFDGAALRKAREASGLSLEWVVAETNVRQDYLSALEEERYEDLPSASVYVRGYLTAYLAAIGQMDEQVVSDYMQRHRQWQARKGK